MSAEARARAAEELRGSAAEIAEQVTDLQYQGDPELAARYGPAGRLRCLEDALSHVGYLAEAVGADSPGLFVHYARWGREVLEGRGVPVSDLVRNLSILAEVVAERLPGELALLAVEPVREAITDLSARQVESRSCLPAFEEPLHELATLYLQHLLGGDRRSASQAVMRAVDAGTPLRDIYTHVFQTTQWEVGRLWQQNRISVAEEHYCTASTQLVMSQLYPRLFGGARDGRRLVATSVPGDLHELGVRMVADFFEMEGWDTFYLGASTPTESLIGAIRDRRADVLALSATMLRGVPAVAEVIARVREACDPVPLIAVGGYAFNVEPTLRERVGADLHASTAAAAIEAVSARLGAP